MVYFLSKRVVHYLGLSLGSLLILLFVKAAFAQERRSPSTRTQGTTIDIVLAEVDGEPITMADLKRYISSKSKLEPQKTITEKLDVKAELQKMISETLLVREAEKAGVKVSDQDVDAYIGELKRQNSASDEQFVAALTERGVTLDDFREQAKAEIARMKVLGLKVRPRVTVLEQDIAAYLSKHPSLLPDEGTIHLEQIVLPARGRDLEGVKTEAEAIREEIESGQKSFAEAGGNFYKDLGFVSPADLKEDLQQAIEGLSVGEVSEVLPIKNGLMLLLVTSREEEKTKIDPQLRDKIYNELFEHRFKDEVDKYLNSELLKNYNTEIKI